jgi:hypothetical protein
MKTIMEYERWRDAAFAHLEAHRLSKADVRAGFIEKMEASEEWKILYPRVYRGVGGFGSRSQSRRLTTWQFIG